MTAGYDVWLGNNRGNHYSKKHVAYDPEREPELFFDYSFYEFGRYDLPAMIDLARKVTGFDKISYIAHSQGTTQMFSALANNHGQMNDKINFFIALAPIANLQRTPIQGLQDVSKKWQTLSRLTRLFGIHEVTNFGTNDKLRQKVCYYSQSMCESVN